MDFNPLKLLRLIWKKKQIYLVKVRHSEASIMKLKISVTFEQTCEQTNLKSGYFSISRTAVAKLRPHFLTVSATGHSQAT